MTEPEWLASAEPDPMIAYLQACGFNRIRNGCRKLQLFTCSCVRRIVRLTTERGRECLEIAERFVDDPSTWGKLRDARREKYADSFEFSDEAANYADEAAWHALSSNSMNAAFYTARTAAFALELQAEPDVLQTEAEGDYEDTANREPEEQAGLLRDIFGNPFRPVRLDPTWLDWNAGCIQKLAQTIYDDRRFDDLPILADTLEEAGCAEPAILEHCRGPGPHVRGCWVVDLLLDKR